MKNNHDIIESIELSDTEMQKIMDTQSELRIMKTKQGNMIDKIETIKSNTETQTTAMKGEKEKIKTALDKVKEDSEKAAVKAGQP